MTKSHNSYKTEADNDSGQWKGSNCNLAKLVLTFLLSRS